MKFDALKELLNDAKTCPRLTPWEHSFLNATQERVEEWGPGVLVTDRQKLVLKQIERKVYATG